MTKAKSRRRKRGSAWYWRQTDSWYYTSAGSRQRVGLFDENGKRIRGEGSKQTADLALARIRVAAGVKPVVAVAPIVLDASQPWLVAKVCSTYLQHCQDRAAAGAMSPVYLRSVVQYLNMLASYCGALPVADLKRGHISSWIESQVTWRSAVTRRNAIGIILAAFNLAEREHGVRNPLKGLKKPPSQPRLISFSAADEQAIYDVTDEAHRNFLFAAIHTGLRPFCELAKLTAEDVEEAPRGMLWRVYSSKTKKTRKIPVRPEVAALTRKLIAVAPRGSGLPLFVNSRGNRWSKWTVVMRFVALREQLGWNDDPTRRRYSTYSCRHTFAHRMLSGYWNGGAGCSIETLAELIGDTPKVAFDHYGREWGQHYQEPLWAAIQGSGPR